MFTWHWAQAVDTWEPVNGNWVLEWSKVAPFQFAVVWHSEQSVGKPAAGWLGLVVPLKSVIWHVAHAVDVSV